MGFGGLFCFLQKEGIYKKSTKHVISFSGGKDSTALLLRMLEEKMPVDVILFCDTGLEFPQMYEHLDKVEQYTGENGLFSMDALPKLLALAEKADALLIGCGLGRSDTLTEIVCTLLEKAACQIVLDADGINSITGHKDILRRTAKPVVLTPHAGEFARLSGKPDATAADAAQFAQDYRCIVLYKGHRTRIFTPDGGCYRNTSGNPGMAKGGSGDVLAGMLVSLCGQGIDAVPAACTAAWLHGRAGDLAANALSEYGMTPSDMLTQLPILLKRYNSKTW